MSRMDDIAKGLPCFLTGDMNCRINTPSIQSFLAKMKNTKQRASSGQWPGFLVYMLSGAACALVFMHSMTVRGQTDTLLPLLLMIPFLLASMVIQTILHEGGHLLFGALTGYRASFPSASFSSCG